MTWQYAFNSLYYMIWTVDVTIHDMLLTIYVKILDMNSLCDNRWYALNSVRSALHDMNSLCDNRWYAIYSLCENSWYEQLMLQYIFILYALSVDVIHDLLLTVLFLHAGRGYTNLFNSTETLIRRKWIQVSTSWVRTCILKWFLCG